MNIEKQIKELITTASKEAAKLENFSTGDLAMEITRRLRPGVAIRTTVKGVRVTHSQYIDALQSAGAVDDALNSCKIF